MSQLTSLASGNSSRASVDPSFFAALFFFTGTSFCRVRARVDLDYDRFAVVGVFFVVDKILVE